MNTIWWFLTESAFMNSPWTLIVPVALVVVVVRLRRSRNRR